MPKKMKTRDAHRARDTDMAALYKRFSEHTQACDLIWQLTRCPAVKTLRVTLREWADPPKMAAFVLNMPLELVQRQRSKRRKKVRP